MTARINVGVRSGLTVQHIQSADFFAQQAASVEERGRVIGVERGDQHYDTLHVQHQAYVTGAIFAAVAFLEAAVNDVFALASDANADGSNVRGTLVEKLDQPIRQRLADAWKGKGLWEWTRKSIRAESGVLPKYDAALALAEKPLPPREKGAGSVYDDASCVVALRNFLMHNIPSTTMYSSDTSIWSDNEETARLARRLSDKKIPPNSLGGAPLTAFPARQLSADCARWAVEASIRFALVFYDRMGIASPFREQLDAIVNRHERTGNPQAF